MNIYFIVIEFEIIIKYYLKKNSINQIYLIYHKFKLTD